MYKFCFDSIKMWFTSMLVKVGDSKESEKVISHLCTIVKMLLSQVERPFNDFF